MSNLSETITEEEVKQIAEKNDFHIAPFREDGETYGTLTWIWSVEVDGELYVRAYNGTSSRWYQAALSQKAGKIEGAGLAKKVKFEPTSGEDINAKIDDAYRAKYSDSPYLSSMISERAKAATVKILPAA
ncbi:DUF2255 family protein [Fulvivirga maritima]|uniref:DUF2255 family protein n=1 Tax=Fulvivirga maritima TaxID=2904247 RepID=UPI001F4003C3|nr:DUF2255 family protein [Fulvivirga maritima]UII25720.1 DUF2255 family protein [Fulvivirga maritima]